jgi:hypothetical protein
MLCCKRTGMTFSILEKRFVLLQSSLQIDQSALRNAQVLRIDNFPRLVGTRPVGSTLASLKHQSDLCAIRAPDLLVLLQSSGHESRPPARDVDPRLQVVLECALGSVQECVFCWEGDFRLGQDGFHEVAGVVLDVAGEGDGQC